jgi:PilZ domain
MANRWHGRDTRSGERVNVNIPVQLSAGALAKVDGCMKNLSLSGALMKAGVDLRLHSLIKVSIKMPSPLLPAEAITAHVSRKVKAGVGVEWGEFAPRIVKDLLRSPSIPLPIEADSGVFVDDGFRGARCGRIG